jgi:hypothetical protein
MATVEQFGSIEKTDHRSTEIYHPTVPGVGCTWTIRNNHPAAALSYQTRQARLEDIARRWVTKRPVF